MNIDGVAVGSKTEPPSSEPISFIPVKGSDDVVPPVTTWLNPLGIYDQSTTQWLQGQGPPEQESKQSDSQTDREGALLKAKVEEFNRRVRENPHDIQLWMAFVAFQVRSAVPLLLLRKTVLVWGQPVRSAAVSEPLGGTRAPGAGGLLPWSPCPELAPSP